MIINKKQLFLILLMASLCLPIFGQGTNFSMYEKTSFLTNPGMIGVNEDIGVSLNYRNKSIDIGENFETSMLSAYYPVNLKTERFVFAINVLNDKGSDFLTTNGGSLTAAYALRITKRSQLSMGIQWGYLQRKIGGQFITDDQIIEGVYDSNIPLTDPAAIRDNRGYMSLSQSLYWNIMDDQEKTKGFIGIGFFDINRPNISSNSTDNVPISVKTIAGYRIYQNMKFSVSPTLRWVHSSKSNFVNLGSQFAYQLMPQGKGVKEVVLGIWYNSNKFGVLALQYSQFNYNVAISYDLPLSSELNSTTDGTFEIAASFMFQKEYKKARYSFMRTNSKSGVNAASKIKRSKKYKFKNHQKMSGSNGKSGNEGSIENRVVSKKNAQPVVFESLKYEINHYDLNANQREYLDHVAHTLEENPLMKLTLIGYMDLVEDDPNISNERTRVVMDYLLVKKIERNRLNVIDVGSSKPLRTASSTKGASRFNRRVELKVVE